MKFTDIECDNITDEIIRNALFNLPQREYTEADYLIIFGSHLKELLDERINKAIELLNLKKIEKVLLTGGVGVNGNFNEAKYMKEKLIEFGVLEEKILTEDKSTTTEENIINCIKLLSDKIDNSRIVLVSNEAHLKRIGMELKKMLKDVNVELIYEYPIDSIISFANVIKNENLRQMAINEIKKIISFINANIIDDENI